MPDEEDVLKAELAESHERTREVEDQMWITLLIGVALGVALHWVYDLVAAHLTTRYYDMF